MTLNSIPPKAIATTSFLLLGVEVIGHQLENGIRVIEAQSMEKIMIAMTDGNIAHKVDLHELQRFTDWYRSNT